MVRTMVQQAADNAAAGGGLEAGASSERRLGERAGGASAGELVASGDASGVVRGYTTGGANPDMHADVEHLAKLLRAADAASEGVHE